MLMTTSFCNVSGALIWNRLWNWLRNFQYQWNLYLMRLSSTFSFMYVVISSDSNFVFVMFSAFLLLFCSSNFRTEKIHCHLLLTIYQYWLVEILSKLQKRKRNIVACIAPTGRSWNEITITWAKFCSLKNQYKEMLLFAKL